MKRRAFLLALPALLYACGGDGSSSSRRDDGLTVEVAVSPAASLTPAVQSTPSAADLRGFIMPVAGGCLPRGDQLMPNAPRLYRNGIHEGVDFYASDNCTNIQRGTPVLAAKDGIVKRADFSYTDLTPAMLARVEANPASEESLDLYRGRQVWVDHGHTVVTRYCHLLDVAPGLSVGAAVKAGQVIASVGESGTPQSITAPGTEYHLHFELRVGASYLGSGLPPAEVRRLYLELFSI